MLEKSALIFYVMSCLALAYVIFTFSPVHFAPGAWQKTDSPLYFFSAAFVFIMHVVVTGKMLSKEKFSKVIWVSSIVATAVAVVMLPYIIGFFLY